MNSSKIWETVHKVKGQKSKVKIEEIIEILLENRGLKSQKEIDAFLHPKLEDVTVESLGIHKKELTKAIKRVRKAIEKKEKIVVYGDYDVDGVTGTAILWESLHALGSNVIPYIPHRIEEGYGLSVKGITNILDEHPDVGLILTVDNGIVANDAVDFANGGNIDVIITDHHTPPKADGPLAQKLPNAYAIVHTTAICGAAVGWMFAKELLVASRKSQAKDQKPTIYDSRQATDDHLSLVALATVADLVPLTGANRTLLKFGLEVLKKTTRPGLLALFEEAKIEPDKIDVYTIGHLIAPRLNAMGRLESAMDSLRLLCTKDTKRAKDLAALLEVTNRDRQLLTSSTVEHAKQQVISLSKRTKILFIHHDSYEEGVIGLVAGKLVETFYLPAVVLSRGEKYSKASARSIAGFNIIEAIRKSSDLLVNAGGHPMAAGFTIETEKLELLREALEQVADGAINETMLKRILRIDMAIPLEIVSQKLYEEIQKLAPFGMACPEPVFVSDVVVQEVRQIGMEGKHLKLKVTNPKSQEIKHIILNESEESHSKNPHSRPLPEFQGEGGQGRMFEMDAIAFGMGEYSADLKKGSTAQLAYTIDENTWNGRTNLQLKIKDIKTSLSA